MIRTLGRTILLSIMTLWAQAAQADLKCSIDLQFGLVVNDKHIRVLDESRTLYQINGHDQLMVKGEWLELSDEQSALLKELAEGLHYVVPKMITLATEGVELAIDTVEHVYLGLVGEDTKSYDKLQSSMEKVQKKVREKFVHVSDNYYIGPGSLENVDDLVDRELEEQLEQAINTSLGGVLSAIGGLAASGDAETEQRMVDLSQRIEIIELELEKKIGPQTDTLRRKAIWFCKKLHYLDQIEEKLRRAIPQLAPYDVILTSESKG